MLLTESIIREYIGRANNILIECCEGYDPPIIENIYITRARSYWAQIIHLHSNHYKLKVSNMFNEIPSAMKCDSRLISCMIHELIHTQEGCWNHGACFKSFAKIINNCYPDYAIGTSAASIDYGVPYKEQPIRYIISCSKCGTENYYRRKPKLWQYINKKTSPYECCICHNSTFKGVTV